MNTGPDDPVPTSFDVRVWGIQQARRQRGVSYGVRWGVAGKAFRRTFTTAKLADGFRAELLTAVRAGKAFDVTTGLPHVLRHERTTVTWFEHARDFVRLKWPQVSPNHRRGIAETLTDVTLELTPALRGTRPAEHDPEQLRRVLLRTAFSRSGSPSPDDVAVLTWLESHSVPIVALSQPQLVRQIHDRLTHRIDGTPAAASTLARKRAVLHAALDAAVEAGHLTVNPLSQLRLRRPASVTTLDRRVVANPSQAVALLAAVRAHNPELEAFFACLYYAGLRPAEALGLTRDNLTLPATGWGEILLTGSQQSTGSAWTDDGTTRQARQLKHRAQDATRPVPAHPELVRILRDHLATFPLGHDGHLFVARTGKAGAPLPPPYDRTVGTNTLYRAWDRARHDALTPAQYAGPLARRPYDLRHACLSTWLNAGVPAAQVAEWAGHGVNVLLRVYAKCIDGQDDLAKRRIEAALPASSPPPAEISQPRRRPAIRPPSDEPSSSHRPDPPSPPGSSRPPPAR